MNKDSTLHDGHKQNLVMIPDGGIITLISAFILALRVLEGICCTCRLHRCMRQREDTNSLS